MASGSIPTDRRKWGFDTLSDVHIVNDEAMLTNMRRSKQPIEVAGINGDDHRILIEIEGDFLGNRAYFYEHAPCNILSAGVLHDDGYSRWIDDYHDEMHAKRGEWHFIFSREHGSSVYTSDMWELVAHVKQQEQSRPHPVLASALVGLGMPSQKRVMATTFDTVAERERLLTTRELKQAKEAWDIWGNIGKPEPKKFVSMLRFGKIKDCRIGPRDFVNALDVWGPDIERIRGGSERERRPGARRDTLGMLVDENVTLDVDIMFCCGVPFLTGVVTPLRKPLVNYLAAKTLRVVREAVYRMKAKVIAQGFKLDSVRCDGEGAIAAMAPELEIETTGVEQAGPDSHLGTIDSVIKQIKRGVRGMIATLSFTLPFVLLVWAVLYMASRISLWPTSVYPGCVTPDECFYGRMVDLRRDIPERFGARVEVQQRTSNSVTAPRTRPGIYLLPTGNVFGTQRVFMLDTYKVATMDQWTSLPMDTVTIQQLNGLATADKRKVGRDPEFRRGSVVIEFEDEDEDESLPHGVRAAVLGPQHVIAPSDNASYDPFAAATSIPIIGGQAVVAEEHGVLREEVPSGGDDHAEFNDPFVALSDEEVLVNASAARSEVSPELQEPSSVPPESQEPSSALAPSVRLSPAPDEHNGGAADDFAGLYDPDEGIPPSHDDEHHEVFDPGEPAAEFGPPTAADVLRRYNLRPIRHRGHVDGDWRARKYETAMQISVKKALEKFGAAAEESIVGELMNLHKKGVQVPVMLSDLTRTQKKSIITSKMFLKEKFLSSGEFDKLKARFVAGGHRQDRSLYSDEETAAPTAALASVYMIASIGAAEGRTFMSMDVGAAYLNAAMVRDVYMRVEPKLAEMLAAIDPSYKKYRNPDGSVVVQLKKALYGCVESAKLWYDNLSATLVRLGFKKNRKDQCVFNKVVNGKQLSVVVYVDDLLCSCEDESALEVFAQQLIDAYKEVKVHRGALHSYLGQTFDFSVKGKAKITMDGYVYDLLELYDVHHYAASPALSTLFDIDPESERLAGDAAAEFHSRVAKLLYLAKRVRPDILCPVIFLCGRVKECTAQDRDKLDRVLGYLNATPSLGVVLEAPKGLQVLAYVDASYGVHADFKSHTGAVVSLGRGPIWAKSTRQKLNTKSSTEAELIAVSDALSQVIWTRDFLIEQGHELGPATLFQDNLSTIALALRGNSNAERTRHIAIRYFFVKDRIESREIAMEHLPTGDMIADMLTKPLQGEKFRTMRRMLLNWE
jgi:hypothetical protein